MLIQVYRQLDVTEPDHAGNREYQPGFFDTDEEAQALADSLNTNDTGQPDRREGRRARQCHTTAGAAISHISRPN